MPLQKSRIRFNAPLPPMRMADIAKPFPGAYKYNPNGKWPWLQRLLFEKVLPKLNCGFTHYEPTFEHHVLEMDLRPLIEDTQEAVYSLYKQYGFRPEYILVGHQEASRYMQDIGEKWRGGPMAFGIPPGNKIGRMISVIDPRSPTGYSSEQDIVDMAGMRVIIVPWMSGVLVLPTLRDLDRR